jgi:hypothetical protein
MATPKAGADTTGVAPAPTLIGACPATGWPVGVRGAAGEGVGDAKGTTEPAGVVTTGTLVAGLTMTVL